MATTNPKSKKSKRKHRTTTTPEADLTKTLISHTKSGDLAAAISVFDSSSPTTRFPSHLYNHLLHVLSSQPQTPTLTAAATSVFAHMLSSGVGPSEATITSMARVAASGDAAFDLVKTMKSKYNISPRLRTYGPALAAFRLNAEAEKAYELEAHMSASGITPEENEITALLEISSKAGDTNRVYEYLHKLRCTVDCVTGSTAEVIESFFNSETAEKVKSERDLEETRVRKEIARNGGGWHGMGWVGNGKWEVRRGKVGADGKCEGCRFQLATVDIGKVEKERFAESVAALALERETKADFSTFQV